MQPKLSRQASAAVESGNLVEAIKLVRAETGLGLMEAKDLVERHGKPEATAGGIAAPADMPAEAIAALHEGRMIGAVRLYRDRNGGGLKEARDAVAHYLDANPTTREQFAGAVGRRRKPWVQLAAAALVLLLAYLFLRY